MTAMASVDFRFYLITDRKLYCNSSLVAILTEAISAGVRAVQIREKDFAIARLYPLVTQINQICQTKGAHLFVNDRVDIVKAASCSGVQLAASSLPVSPTRKILGSKRLIGVSTHSKKEAVIAEKTGCDFILFGPVFATASKRKYGPPQGLDKLRIVCESVRIPVFAVGGVAPGQVQTCRDCGAHGVATISGILGYSSIAEGVLAFRRNLGEL